MGVSVRPDFVHVIGFSGNTHSNLEDWYHQFSNHRFEESFWEFSKDIFAEIENSDSDYLEELESRFKDVELGTVVQGYFRGDDIVLGILLPYHFEESRLYGHQIGWSLLESGILPDQNVARKIPYTDYSIHLGKSDKKLLAAGGLELVNRLKGYQGQWARKYPNSTLWLYDYDFEFAFRFFAKLGFTIERKELDRYMIFEWN
jgi:hypothetical protein